MGYCSGQHCSKLLQLQTRVFYREKTDKWIAVCSVCTLHCWRSSQHVTWTWVQLKYKIYQAQLDISIYVPRFCVYAHSARPRPIVYLFIFCSCHRFPVMFSNMSMRNRGTSGGRKALDSMSQTYYDAAVPSYGGSASCRSVRRWAP